MVYVGTAEPASNPTAIDARSERIAARFEPFLMVTAVLTLPAVIDEAMAREGNRGGAGG